MIINNNVLRNFIFVIFYFLVLLPQQKIMAQSYNSLLAQFYQDKYLLNPAYAGAKKDLNTWIGYRTSQINYDGRPSLVGVAADMSFMPKMGAGVMLMYDASGYLGRFRTSLGYSYRLQLTTNRILAFGVNVGTFAQKLQLNNLDDASRSDPALQGYRDEPLEIEGGFGAVYEGDGLEIGFAMPSLKKSSFQNTAAILNRPFLTTNIAYALTIDEDNTVTPLANFMIYRGYQNQLNFGAEYCFAKTISFFSVYNVANKALSGGMHYFSESFWNLMLSYSTNFGVISQYFGGAIEVGVGFKINVLRKPNGK